MSRHRNIRNMDIDDYYDDYYDDYDDYYDDEYYDDDYAYTAPKKSNNKSNTNKNKNNNQAKAKAKPSTATKTKVSTSSSSASKPSSKTTATTTTTGANPFTVVSKKQNIQAITTGTGTKTKTTAANNKNNDNIIREEKMGLITAMGFSTDQAKRALEKSNGDVESAINILLVPSSDNNSDATVSAASPASSSLPVTTPSSVISKQSSQPKQQQESKDYLARQEILKQFNSSSNKSKNKNNSNSNSNNRSKLSMVVLGHVDAGKSTLVGQLLLKLGYVDKRQIQKYEKQANDLYNGKSSFALAWVMDENESERERGVTMEVGTKHVQIENHDLTILDSPGHADFIPSMITGAASADVGLLVVAATPGEFEDGFASGSHNNSNSQQQQYNHQLTGQTREHVILARGLGVNQLIVAVNKLDMSQPTKWNQQRFKDIQQQLKPFLKASGFNLKRVKFVPVSSFYGINFLLSKKSSSSSSTSTEKDHENMLRKWYTGPTLIEAMNQFIPAQRNLEKPLRFIVNDVSPEGKGRLLIRGKVVQGFIRTFDKIIILPISDEATVNRVMTNNNESDGGSSNDGIAFAGENAEISINGVDVARVSPGVIICHSSITTYYEHSIKDSILVPLRNKFTAQIVVMDDLSVPIIRGANMILHMHSIDVPAVMTKLISTNKMNGKSNNNNKNNNTTTTTIATGAAALKKRPPRVITGGSTAHVEITTSEKLCVEEFNKCRALGRFVLRRGGDTIAVGIIETLMDSKKKKTGYYY